MCSSVNKLPFYRIQEFAPPSQAVLEVNTLPICPSVSVLIAMEAILNPTNDVQPFVEQIGVTEKLMVRQDIKK